MYCTNCGSQNAVNASFCAYCGVSLTGATPIYPPHIPNYLVRAILVTIFCCLPLGIVSIVYAAQVNGMVDDGDIVGAMRASANARTWAWITFWVGLLFVVGYLAFGVIGIMDSQEPSPQSMGLISAMAHTSSSRAAYLGLALLAAVGIAFLYVFDPRSEGIFPVCPFLFLTGCYCPGCGTLRAMHVLLHGDAISAIGYNALAVLSLPFIAYSYGRGALRSFGLRAPHPVFVHPRLIWALLAAIVAYWILRNLPFAPLSVLAP